MNSGLLRMVSFYGTILGIFATAFFLKFVKGRAVFISAIITQIIILALFVFFKDDFSYLYLNLIGCGLVMLLASLMSIANGGQSDDVIDSDI